MEIALNRGAVFTLLFLLPELVIGQIRYSIPEEQERGAFVGNIAEDLGLNVRQLFARRFRLGSEHEKRYLEVNLENGILFVNERIDREQLCGQSPTCFISLEAAVENPLGMYRIEVEIRDINDNSPSFPKSVFFLQVFELTAPGARFPLKSAHDPDIGTNAVNTYQISSNDYFGLKMQSRSDGVKIAELLLEKPLDREKESTFQLVLTAIDGGIPHRSGTAQTIITVLDANDNAPVFGQDIYRTNVVENAPEDTLVMQIHAVDSDEGQNAEVRYSFSNHASQRVSELFKLDPETGEITVKGLLDFEESDIYELDIQAVDNGQHSLVGHAKVLVGITDVNDNFPEIKLTSVSRMIPEDAALGTVVAVISIEDRDSGEDGHVYCQVPMNIPFKIQTYSKNQYKLVTSDALDRETSPSFNISISAWDSGTPPLSTNKTISVSVSDMNDNAPLFTQSSYNVYVMENNAPGASISAVTAVDPDLDQNGEVSYSVLEDNRIQSESPYVTINSQSGTIYALRSFDYEQLKRFRINVHAKDGGFPPMSSSAIVNVIILDQNDNAPLVVSSVTWNASAAVKIAPQSTYPGDLIARVMAADADSGQNARLSYQLIDATDRSLFSLERLTGEIRTLRKITEQDDPTQHLIIMVMDNGQPRLSSTATVLFSILPNVTETLSERSGRPGKPQHFSELNFYLIITLASTSLIFLIAIIFLVAVKCHQDRGILQSQSYMTWCFGRRFARDVVNRRPAPKGPPHLPGVSQATSQREAYNFRVSLSPEASTTEFLFLQPCNPTLPFNDIRVNDSKLSKSFTDSIRTSGGY
uniref:Protocadherin gamma-C3 n=1 Tax=Callorhinchus milii TaxID=7868 RepID=B0YN57_CALMI|nr:protocadherin epsilon2 [Callorhinchus milii]